MSAVLGRVQRAEELRHLLEARPSCSGSGQNQIASVSNVVSGMSERDDVDRRSVADRLARVADDLLRHRDAAEVELDAEPALGSLARLDRRLRLLLHLRVPVDTGRSGRAATRLLEVERLDEVLLAEVEVHRALVHGRVRAVALDEAEERAGLAVDDRERLGVARAQRDARGRIVAPLPDVAGGRALELRELGGALRAPRARASSASAVVERRLERGGEDVRVEDPRVRVVEDRRLDPAREERVRLACEELVERVLARDEDCEPASRAAPRVPTAGAATRSCPGSRPRSHSRGGRCRSRARARPSPSRRAARPRPAVARSRAAARACSPPGTERAGAPSRRRRARRRSGG